MKYYFKVLLSLLLFSTISMAASGARNGGDQDELEVIAIARQIHEILRLEGASLFPAINLEIFGQSIEETNVKFVDEVLLLDGQERTAINHPDQNLIEVNRTKYQSLENNYLQKVSLVFHEYLGVMRVRDDQYTLSSRFLNFIARISLDFPTRNWSCSAFCNTGSQFAINGMQVMEGRTSGDAFRKLQDKCAELYPREENARALVIGIGPGPGTGRYLQIFATVSNSCIKN